MRYFARLIIFPYELPIELISGIIGSIIFIALIIIKLKNINIFSPKSIENKCHQNKVAYVKKLSFKTNENSILASNLASSLVQNNGVASQFTHKRAKTSLSLKTRLWWLFIVSFMAGIFLITMFYMCFYLAL